MKKLFWSLIILISCFFISPTVIFSNAEETDKVNISTLYPENVLYYANLENISNIAINNEYIAYNLNTTTLSILNIQNKQLINVNNFSNIIEYKFITENKILVIDNNSSNYFVKVVNLSDTTYSVDNIDSIPLNGLKLIDIYTVENKIFIGVIKNSTIPNSNNYFELYELECINNTLSNPIKKDTFTAEQFNEAFILTINNNQLFVIFNNDDNKPRLLNRNYGSSTIITTDVISNIQLLDYYKHNDDELLVAFTLENLTLIELNNFNNSETKISELNISDIDILNGKIYIAESNNNSIVEYNIAKEESTYIFEEANVLISSNSIAPGRFFGVNDIYIQGNTLYVSDTKNNRIQIINNGKVSVIDHLSVETQPHSIQIDDKQNLFIVEKTTNITSSIIKYSLDTDNNYYRQQTYSTFEQSNLGRVSDTTITINNQIYLIDYTNNKLLALNSDTGIQPKLTLDFTTNAFTEIEYIRGLNLLAILNNNTIYILDPIKIESDQNAILYSIVIENCADITCGLNSIIALCDNEIKNISIDKGNMQINEKSLKNNDFNYFSNITYNISNSKIYAFDSRNQSIVYFDYYLENENLQFDNINEIDLNILPYAFSIKKDALIYQLPYNLGNQYSKVSNCIGIELYNNAYYRVLFNYSGELEVGFIHKDFVTLTPYSMTQKLNVITTNLKVPVYKYPTILKYNNQTIIREYIPIHTSIQISLNPFPISIDDKQFYLYEYKGKLGYIFNADVILDDNSNIITLYNNNATIKVIGEEDIYIYDEDKQTIIYEVSNNSRINVESYDKNSEYTLVHFKTADLKTVTGYIKTDYIKMDKLDSSKIILISIIIFSILILISIIVTFIIIKKKKN